MEKYFLESACLLDGLDAFTQFLSEIQEEVFQHSGNEHEYCILVHEGERKVRPSKIIVLNIKVFLSFSITMMLRQNKLCKSSDEKAVFWRNIEYLATDGKIFKNADFKIRTISDLELTDGRTINTAFPVSYLFVNKKRIMQLFNQCVLRQGEKTIPVDTLTHYLENSPQYVGNVKAVAFDCIVNGQLQYVTEPRTGKTKKKRNALSAMVFDYGALKTAYELGLEGFDRTDQDTIAFEQSNTESTENGSTISSAQNNDGDTEPQQPDDDDYP